MTPDDATPDEATPDEATGQAVRRAATLVLGGFLLVAGTGHLVVPRTFLAQVPSFLPWREGIVVVSGAVEIALGAGLLLLPRRRVHLGWIVAALFVVVFPGNVNQALTGSDAFGLDSTTARWGRLALQPLLVVWALWCTGAWRSRPWRAGAGRVPPRQQPPH